MLVRSGWEMGNTLDEGYRVLMDIAPGKGWMRNVNGKILFNVYYLSIFQAMSIYAEEVEFK